MGDARVEDVHEPLEGLQKLSVYKFVRAVKIVAVTASGAH